MSEQKTPAFCCVVSFLEGMFKDVISILGYITLDGRMIDELERNWKETIVP
jgi:hypothetical protein